jgi:hypothetical protein
MHGTQQLKPISPEQELSVGLRADEWNVVQAALHELPMKLVRALSDKIGEQLFRAAHELEPREALNEENP